MICPYQYVNICTVSYCLKFKLENYQKDTAWTNAGWQHWIFVTSCSNKNHHLQNHQVLWQNAKYSIFNITVAYMNSCLQFCLIHWNITVVYITTPHMVHH